MPKKRTIAYKGLNLSPFLESFAISPLRQSQIKQQHIKLRTNKQIGELKNDPKQVAFRAEILEIKKFLNADLGRRRERDWDRIRLPARSTGGSRR